MRKILFSLFATATFFAWDAMKAQTVIFEDSFENYTDFSIANVGNWTLIDVDMKPTFGFNGVTYPNAGAAKSFQVFNSTLTSPPLDPSATSNWTARTGSKAMVSFGANSSPWSNDWLISPAIQLGAEGGIVSFWAKGCDANYGEEKFKVLVSTTGTAIGDFAPISSVTTTPSDVSWNKYSYSLAAYVGQNIYIAIQCTSDDQFGFAVDDFLVTTPPTTAPNCATLMSPANGATDIAYITSTLTWAASTTGSTVESYDIYLDKNTSPTTMVGTVQGTSYIATNLDPSSTYYWKVVPKNTAGSATGCLPYSFTTMAPTYCTAGASVLGFETISNVTFSDINNNSTAPAGYEDFSTVIGNVTAGITYTFTASTDDSYEDDQVLVWIDFNNDKDFDDAGEQVLVTAISEAPWTGSITIPAGTPAGQVRMRVRLHDSVLTPNVTPCGTSSFGQVEDYTLNITTLAVSDVNKSQVKVYPNPVVDVLNIDADSKVSGVQVFDLSGKAVSSFALNQVKNQVNLGKLAPGVYVVNIQTEKGIQSVKIVKK